MPPPPGDADDATILPVAEVDAEDPSVRSRALRDVENENGANRFARLADRVRRAASVVSIVALLVGSALGGRAAHRWMTHTPRFGAREIEVVGATRIRRDEVLRVARIDTGTNVLGLDTVRAERAIEQLPWVERAHVSRRLPGQVRIELEERSAAALVSAGALYLAAPDGTLFKRLQPGDPDDLPVITGISRREFEHDPDIARQYVRDALALLADFDSSSLARRVRVEEVHREPTGDLALSLAQPRLYVWLGRGPYRAKMARLSAILSEIERQHIEAVEVHLESDRHPERATVRVALPEAPRPLPVAEIRPANAPRSVSARAHPARPERMRTERSPSRSRTSHSRR